MKYLKVAIPGLLFLLSLAVLGKYGYNTYYEINPIPEFYKWAVTGFFGVFFFLIAFINGNEIESL